MIGKKAIRNALTIGVITILVGTTIFSPANHVNADSLSKPNWKEGDYWGYSLKDYSNKTEEGKPSLPEIAILEEVIGNSTLTIEDITYEVAIIKRIECHVLSSIVNDDKDDKKNYTYKYELCNFTGLFYYRQSDLAIVKILFNWWKMPTWESDWKAYTAKTILNPLLDEFGFPLEIRKEWQSCSNLTQTISDNGLSNNSYTTKMCHNFTCIGKTDVETDIGIFPSYIIKSWMGKPKGDMYEISYYSPLAGNIVKKEEYQEDHICEVQILKAFSYQGRTHGRENDKNDIPGFEFLSLIIAMVAVILLSKKIRW